MVETGLKYNNRQPILASLLSGLIFSLLIINFMLAVADPVFLSGKNIIDDLAILVIILGFLTIGTIVIIRASGHLVGWIYVFIAFIYMLQQMLANIAKYLLVFSGPNQFWGPALAWTSNWLGIIFFASLMTLPFLYFPDGHLVSPRWRIFIWSFISMVAIQVIFQMLEPGPLINFTYVQNPFGIPELVDLARNIRQVANFLGGFAIAISAASLVLRYRRSQGVERMQIKWLAYGAALPVILVFMTSFFIQSYPDSVLNTVLNWFLVLSLLMVPISTGLAILRYRLYSIDNLIRRTLVYTLLTGLLGLAYFGGVALLQSILTANRETQAAINGKPSAVVIVMTTLAIAAIFNPLRKRIQDFIDRRFYRQKYDSERALEGFATVARSETDLNQISYRLNTTISETLQPKQVSIWISSNEVNPISSMEKSG